MELKQNETKRIKIVKRRFIILISLLLVLAAAFYIYTLDYYRASEAVHDLMVTQAEQIEIKHGLYKVKPTEQKDSNTGLIFYPGGKVEAIAYLPLLLQLSKEGITCILIEMPMNLAVFDVDAADPIFDDYKNIDTWYIAGHSLGGAMASSYMKDNSSKVQGLILLGAYPINDADVDTLAIYGSEDLALDQSKLERTKNTLKIPGGNHAYFGNYGEQEGDGTAVISRERQQAITVKTIMQFIHNN